MGHFSGLFCVYLGFLTLHHHIQAREKKGQPGEKLHVFPDFTSFQSSGKELILVLDLDSTLIYYVGEVAQGDIPLTSYGGKEFVNVRPYVKDFLVQACDLFYCIVYTAGTQEYGGDIVAHLNRISGLELAFRNRCHCEEYLRDGEVIFHHKNLENIIPLELHAKTIILDDTWQHYERFETQVSNVIKIKAWTGNQKDAELTKVLNLLMHHFPNGKFPSDTALHKTVQNINDALDVADLQTEDIKKIQEEEEDFDRDYGEL